MTLSEQIRQVLKDVKPYIQDQDDWGRSSENDLIKSINGLLSDEQLKDGCFEKMAEDRDQLLAQLQVKTKELQAVKAILNEVKGCFEAAIFEGLETVLADADDPDLKDLVERRLMHAYYAVPNHGSSELVELTPERMEEIVQKAKGERR